MDHGMHEEQSIERNGAKAARPAGVWSRLRAFFSRRVTKRPIKNRERGVAILVVVVTTAVIGATAADFAYSAQIELEAANNSRDQLRAEYLAKSGMQMGRLLTAVQGALQGMLAGLPPQFRDAIIVTDYADFLVKAISGDVDARAGLGGLVGLDLENAEGLGTPKGTGIELSINSEEGKFPLACASGNNANDKAQRSLYQLLLHLVRPQRYDRMFSAPDRDGVVITREDLPTAIIDWADVDPLRFSPFGPASASEERYDRGQDRYEAHNHYLDTSDELMLVRGVSEDFWGAFGELFTVYSSQDCRVLTGAMDAKAWPLLAAMIAASSSDRNAVFDPNTALVAQQMVGLLKTGLPMLKEQLKVIPACKTRKEDCPDPKLLGTPPAATVQPSSAPGGPPGGSGPDAVSTLSDLICSDAIAAVPQLAEGLSSMLGSSAAPKPVIGLRAIPMCPGMLSQFLREKAANGKNPRRFYRMDATGTVQRGVNRMTQVHIRGVWDTGRTNHNPVCVGHPSCYKGTWVYYRID